MRPARILAALAIVVACAGSPARPIPLLGGLDIGLTWSPGHPAAGGTVTFTATASDGDGAIRVATLCFGDGTPCASDVRSLSAYETGTACVFGDSWDRQFAHRFPNRTGSYRVTLTVSSRGCPTLADETATRSYTINVG